MTDYDRDGLKVEVLLEDIMNTIDEKVKLLDAMKKEDIYFEWDKLATSKEALLKAKKTVKRAHAGYVGGEIYSGEFAHIEDNLW